MPLSVASEYDCFFVGKTIVSSSFDFAHVGAVMNKTSRKFKNIGLYCQLMESIGKEFFLAFMPLFFAIDALGILPLFLSITSDSRNADIKKILRDAIFAAFIVSVVFLLTGKLLFRSFGITADDFRIGGGLVLLLIAILNLLFSSEGQGRSSSNEMGVVPIGIPLIIGPAALTTIIMSVDRHGLVITLLSLVINLLLTWLIFSNSKYIVRVMGKGGTRAFGKVASLFLAAIAVMMIRVGITNTIMGGLK